jgi:hypothetical protein
MKVDLFINDIIVDLFKDESIVVNDVLQDIKDISKVFSPFTKTFTVPASKTNNQLFEHYYNFDIDDGFDARFKVPATIRINGADFKKGEVRLDSVKLEQNKAVQYNITFFGEPSTIKEIFGDEKLSSLSPLNAYDIKYGADFLDSLRTGLQSTGVLATNLSNRNIVTPLITLENYYTYDAGTITTPNIRTVTFTDLKKEIKPAIKVKRIIEAIETQYNVEFNMADEFTSGFMDLEDGTGEITDEADDDELVLEDAEGGIQSFFGSEMFEELYLWLHRQDSPTSLPETDPPTFGVALDQRGHRQTFADYTYLGGAGNFLNASNQLVVPEGETYSIRIRLIPLNTTTVDITVKDIITNEILYIDEGRELTSGVTTSFALVDLTSGLLKSRTYDLSIRFTSRSVLNFDATPSLASHGLEIIQNATNISYYGNSAFSLLEWIFIEDFIPDMKVIDFLSGLLKTFNLTAYVRNDSNKIYIQTFDDFMTLGTDRDITSMVKIDKTDVTRPIPYSAVNFKYQKGKTQTALRYNNAYSEFFGDLRYQAPEKYDGQSFDLTTPFQQSPLKRIVGTNASLGWWVDKDGKTTVGAPYLFFNRMADVSSTPLVSTLASTTICCPSHTSEDTNHSLCFNAQWDEFNEEINYNSLFSRFYQQYIVQTFTLKGRIIKVKAVLTTEFILNYKINDTIVIAGREYYINSVKINLLTKEADFELIVKVNDYTASVLT